jgi:S-adenosylmethionine:tRNA ribosyltransferase-isomerase
MPDSVYQFSLPPSLIAQTPAVPRDSSRLLVIDKHTGKLTHHIFRSLPRLLRPSDVLVFNNSAVFPARLHAVKPTGGKVEILLLKNIKKNLWEVISHPGIKPGQHLSFSSQLSAAVVSATSVEFSVSGSDLSVPALINRIGSTPLPPYIHYSAPESLLRRQYQTVYAKASGSAAAPTAGLHFTPRLLSRLSAKGIQLEYVTLHVGLGTFKPPTKDQITAGVLHSEWFTLSPDTADHLNAAKSAGRRVIAVGTTTTRVLESCAHPSGRLAPQTGETNIFIRPPYKFRFVDGLITNFHLPGSSLLMLVSAFTSPQIIRSVYRTAVKNRYRFFSFGDACLFT